MIGLQLSKSPAIFCGSKLTKTMPKPSKISIRVAFIYLHVIHYISMKNYLKAQFSLWVTWTLEQESICDSVCKEGKYLITNDQSEFSLCPTQRNNFDNLLNSQDKRLLEIFKNADLRILNGRVSGGSLGRVTFHGKNGVSAVDYAVCDQDLLSHIPNFVVKDPLHLSDHSAITTWLNNNKKTSYNHTILEGDTLTRLPKQFLWENDSAQKSKDDLSSPRIQTLIRDYIAADTFN